MNYQKTALILIGYQNDYFAPDGILHEVIREGIEIHGVLRNTLSLIDALKETPITMVSTPILFTPDYLELIQPIGILETIKQVGAFQRGTKGGATIPEILNYGERITEIPGKRGLNAFSNTDLHAFLSQRKIETIILAGVVTSICIDSTGRDAFEKGYEVVVVSDCTSGRSTNEQDFYCQSIFPVYSKVMNTQELLMQMAEPAN